jgi:hypothetical protein
MAAMTSGNRRDAEQVSEQLDGVWVRHPRRHSPYGTPPWTGRPADVRTTLSADRETTRAWEAKDTHALEDVTGELTEIERSRVIPDEWQRMLRYQIAISTSTQLGCGSAQSSGR